MALSTFLFLCNLNGSYAELYSRIVLAWDSVAEIWTSVGRLATARFCWEYYPDPIHMTGSISVVQQYFVQERPCSAGATCAIVGGVLPEMKLNLP